MSDYTVSAQFDLLAHQELTHSATLAAAVGTARTATDMLGVHIHMHHGFIEGAQANTNPGSFYVQTRLNAAGDEWVTVAQFITTNATPVTEQIQTGEAATSTTILVTSTTGFANGDYIYIDDADAVGDSEWHQIEYITTDTSVELFDGLVNGKDSDDYIYSDAEHFSMYLDLAGIADYRVCYRHNGATGANTAIWVTGIEVTDFA